MSYNLYDFTNISDYHGKAINSYAIKPSQLKQISKKINEGFEDIQQLFATNVMESVISIKQYPFRFASHNYIPLDEIYLGKYATDIGGIRLDRYSISDSSSPFYPKQSFYIDLSSTFFDNSLWSFKNNEPFTHLSVYLPYDGFNAIPLSDVGTDRPLFIDYITDYATGETQIFLTNESGVIIYTKSTKIGFEIPLSATNQREIDRNIAMSASRAIIGTTSAALSLDFSAYASSFQGVIDSALAIPHAEIRGSIGSNWSQLIVPEKPFAIVQQMPMIPLTSGFMHTYGLPVNSYKLLSSQHGFTKCGSVHVDIPTCLESEREEIESLLKDGVIL